MLFRSNCELCACGATAFHLNVREKKCEENVAIIYSSARAKQSSLIRV